MAISKRAATCFLAMAGPVALLAGCATQSTNWRRTGNEKIALSGHEQPRQKHPDAGKAKNGLSPLRSEAAWKSAKSANTVAGYNGFLAHYPKSIHAHDAAQMRDSLMAKAYRKRMATACLTLVGQPVNPTGMNGIYINGSLYDVTFSSDGKPAPLPPGMTAKQAATALAAALNYAHVTDESVIPRHYLNALPSHGSVDGYFNYVVGGGLTDFRSYAVVCDVVGTRPACTTDDPAVDWSARLVISGPSVPYGNGGVLLYRRAKWGYSVLYAGPQTLKDAANTLYASYAYIVAATLKREHVIPASCPYDAHSP